MKAIFLSILLMFAVASLQAQTGLLKVADFECGDLSQLTLQKAKDDSILLVTEPVRAGKYAAKTLLRSTDPEVHRGQRAEFSDGRKLTTIEMEKDYWYGLSIFVPNEFVPPSKESNSDAVLFQWHTQQSGPSPVLAIRVREDEWLVTSHATGKRRHLVKIPLVKGHWTDWVVHVKWSAEEKGFWKIFKDGIEVVNERDIVTQYPEALGPYAKFGQYHSVGEVAQNVVYFDEYRVAGSDGTYELVAPSNASHPKNNERTSPNAQ